VHPHVAEYLTSFPERRGRLRVIFADVAGALCGAVAKDSGVRTSQNTHIFTAGDVAGGGQDAGGGAGEALVLLGLCPGERGRRAEDARGEPRMRRGGR
jgi:hypothetical protein